MDDIKVVSEFKARNEEKVAYDDYVKLCDKKYMIKSKYYNAFGRLVESVITEDENTLFSPLALLFSMISLINMTEGKTKAQIEEVLGLNVNEASELYEGMRSVVSSDIFEGSVCNVAGSVWLNELLDVNLQYVKELCDKLSLSAYSCCMGKDSVNNAIQKWLNDNTGNMLTDAVSSVKLKPETYLAMYSALHIKSSWFNEFSDELTEKGMFNTLNDGPVECDFMIDSYKNTIYQGDGFRAITLALKDDYEMTFMLPDNDIAIKDLVCDKTFMDFVLERTSAIEKEAIVHMQIPKFDLKSKIDIKSLLQGMGIEDVFDVNKANFSPLTTKTNEIFVSKIEQNTSLKIDEEGIEGASYVETVVYCGCAPEIDELEDVDFILDRPFMVAVSRYNIPLLVGYVENPNE